MILVLALAMLTTMFAGCADSTPAADNQTTAATTAAATAATTAAATTASASTSPVTSAATVKSDPVPLDILCTDNADPLPSYNTGLEGINQIAELANVTITFNAVPFDQFETIYASIMASKERPDIVAGLYTDLRKAYNGGLIIDMKDALEQYAPNTTKYFEEERPDVKAIITQYDGKIFGLPIVVTDEDYGECFMIRQDWLDKLNLEIPTTYTELLDVLRAFRDQDPNGNGKQDEIPTTMSSSGINTLYPAMFGLHTKQDFDVKDGVAIAPFTQTEYRDLLRYMKGMYDEKLLDNGFTAQTGDQISSMLVNNLVGFYATWMPVVAMKNAENPDAHWVPMLIPDGPNGTSYFEKQTSTTGNTVITTGCENVEAAMTFLDMLYASPEGRMMSNYGVEGVTYTMVDGKPQYTDFALKNPDGLTIQQAIGSVGGFASQLPNIRSKASYDTFMDPEAVAFNEIMKTRLVDVYPSTIISKTDEESEIQSIWPDMYTYKKEMQIKFVTGQANIESDKDWNAYLEQLDKLNLQEYLEVEQAKADRYYASQK